MNTKKFYEEQWFWFVILGILLIIGVSKRKTSKVIVCGNGNGENNQIDIHFNLQ